MTEPLLRVDDVAKVLGRKRDAVLRRIHARPGRPRLRALRDGNEYLIRRQDLEAYLKSIEFEPAQPIEPLPTANRSLAEARHVLTLAKRRAR